MTRVAPELAPRPRPPDVESDRPARPRVPRAIISGVLVPPLVGLLIGTTFVAVFLAAFHDPVPHGLPVAVVGPPQVLGAVTAQSADDDDALDVREYDDAASARAAVQERRVYGALVVDTSGARLLVAGANGTAVTQTLQGAFGAAAQASGAELEVTDVSPLSDDDSRGLSVFYGAFGVVLAGFLFGLTSRQTASHLGPRQVAGSTVIFSVLAGLVVAVLVQPVFGALPAPFAATAGIVALLALAIAATTTALLTVLGPGGIFVSAVLLLVVGNATSTGILPAQYLPGWLEPLAGVLPVGVAVRALRGQAYFGGDGLGPAVGVLAAWTLGAALLVVVASRVRSRRAASPPPRHKA